MKLILCTAPVDKGEELANVLVREQMAACVNIVEKVRSIYVWKGQLCNEEEVLLFLKTPANKGSALCARLKELHPYEVPEIIVLDFRDDEGNPDYIEWVSAAVR